MQPVQNPKMDKNIQIAAMLLAWYDDHARILPWRILPHSDVKPDPYRIWLSEIMLQQTTVAAVKPYFLKFLELWPTVEALACAHNDDVMAAWAGLGYYARARNLHACAKYIVENHGGIFPATEQSLRELPGVGAYTSAAISAIAFGKRAVVVDANVERVVARLFAIKTPLPAAKKEITIIADHITPDDRTGDFAQAMMDLGATICTSKAPQCLICPLTASCQARAAGIADQLPYKSAKKAKPQKRGWLWWIERDDHVLLIRRPQRGLLGGMMAFPGSEWLENTKEDDVLPLLPDKVQNPMLIDPYVQHSFTHFDLKLHIIRLSAAMDYDEAEVQGQWWSIANLDQAGLPTLYKKAVVMMRSNGFIE